MNTQDMKPLCLKHVYGAALTESEQGLLNSYVQTTQGAEELNECQQMKNMLSEVADVKIKPIDKAAMIQRFETTVRDRFKQTVFRPYSETLTQSIVWLFLAFAMFTSDWYLAALVCVALSIAVPILTWLQRRYTTAILSRPDLYEYAKASKQRSKRFMRSPLGITLMAALTGLTITGLYFGLRWTHQTFGLVGPLLAILVLALTAIQVIYAFNQVKKSEPEIWDWWEQEIKE